MVSSLLINFLLFFIVAYGFRNVQILSIFISRCLKVILLTGLCWLVITAVGYLATPLFFDHAEANISAVASYILKGNPVYTSLDAAARYSLLYGPWPYLMAAFFQSLGGSTVLLGKLPGVINLGILFTAAIWLNSELKTSKFNKVFVIGILAMPLLGYYNFSYWNRPDSFVTAYAFLSFAFAVKSHRIGGALSAVCIGLLAGLAVSCKLHSALYFLPTIAYLWETQKFQINFANISACLLAFLAGIVLPFMLRHVDAEAYLMWLKMAANHGLGWKDFARNLTFISSFLLFAYFIGVFRRSKFTFLALLLVSGLIATVASKPGAGVHHFMPLIPLILWLCSKCYFEMDSDERRRANIFVTAFLLTLSLNAINRQKRIVKLFSETAERKHEFADLQNLTKDLEGDVELGYSTNAKYESSFYKTWLVGEDKGLLLDGAALMDMKASRLDIPPSTLKVIKSCKISYFVFPKEGEPWSLLSFYSDEPLFSPEFKGLFQSTYYKVRETEFFALYQCKSP
ncbi:hypothetical protein QJS83_15345 [Bdellovibrio sp. 22V]|uniref:hypothetical protein n=1 Tax=Bdellovibrio sp. 22V TaxID=3044166 RepID=UPI00254388B1|nr:hypothetical protein [Bdellovibrio sp. 22V]WII71838.1 hypothetical protein QJS83_15345 [Bdellovibrio sp. 22V]